MDAAARGSGRRIWIFRLLAAALAAAAVLLLAEGAARVYARATGQDRAMAFDPELGWRPYPNLSKMGPFWGVTRPARTNSRGWRDEERAFEKPPSVRRALLLGDSFAFGLFVDDGDRLSELLERDVDGLEVVNISVSAWGPDQELRALQIEGLRYSPDFLVFLTFPHNDLDDIRKARNASWPKPRYDLVDGELRLVKPEPTWDVRLRSLSYLAEFLYRHAHTDGMAAQFAPGWGTRDPVPLYAAIVRSMAEECRARGIAHVAVIAYPPERIATGPTEAERRVRTALEEEGFATCDTFEVFRDRAAAGETLYVPGGMHWNRHGHELAARTVRAFLLERGLVQ